MLIYRDESKDGEVDWAKLGQEYEEYYAAVSQAGVMRGGKKLQPSATATTVAVRSGGPTGRSPRPVSSWAGSSCWSAPIWTRRWSGRRAARERAMGRSRRGR